MKLQSLADRINSKYADAFMEMVSGLALRKSLGRVRKVKSVEILDIFGRVFLQNSTQIKFSERPSDFS